MTCLVLLLLLFVQTCCIWPDYIIWTSIKTTTPRPIFNQSEATFSVDGSSSTGTPTRQTSATTGLSSFNALMTSVPSTLNSTSLPIHTFTGSTVTYPDLNYTLGTIPSTLLDSDADSNNIHIGLLIPSNLSETCGFDNTASAVTIALNRIRKERLLPKDTNFTVSWRIVDCVDNKAIGYSFDLIVNEKVDVLLAPPCISGAMLAGFAGAYYNVPVLLWGYTFESQFGNVQKYPTIVSVLPTYKNFARVVCEIMNYFNWTSYALVTQEKRNSGCSSLQMDMKILTSSMSNCVISYSKTIDDWETADIESAIEQIKAKTRIVVMCFDEVKMERLFAIELQKAGLDTKDYVYLLLDSDMQNDPYSEGMRDNSIFWVNTSDVITANDEKAWKIAQNSFLIHVDKRVKNKDAYVNFSQEVVAEMAEWPFYCSYCTTNENKASIYASSLHDATYLYGRIVANMLSVYTHSLVSASRNGVMIALISNDIKFEGLSGSIAIGKDATQNSIYLMSSFKDRKASLQPVLSFFVTDINIMTYHVTNASDAEAIWKTRGGLCPPSTPACDVDNPNCTKGFFFNHQTLLILLVIIGAGILILIIFIVAYTIRYRIRDSKAQNMMWQIDLSQLTKSHGTAKNLRSWYSFHSGLAVPLAMSNKPAFKSTKADLRYSTYVLSGENVIGINYNVENSGFQIKNQDLQELRAMRSLDNDNINKFIGLTLTRKAPILSVWGFCSRGSLSNLIAGNNMLTMDGFFFYSLIKDVCEGLKFLHLSSIHWHGNLKSTNCFINDRWQVKLSDFGLKFLRARLDYSAHELLWTAPEHLRENSFVGSKKGDVYSFAMVASEVLNMKPLWDSEDKQDPEKTIYIIKQGGLNPIRPVLNPVTQNIDSILQHLISECWSEEPAKRPKIESVYALLQSSNKGRSSNLMDHVFGMLEHYASNLERDVQDRTKELIEEKKKSDILLYRMLPQQVADKLKLSQTVEPESFEKVTVFFSDVVGFATLVSKCTPIQVVNLLNNLYTLFDSVIVEYDVYKVETIGDNYLCVSGLPRRNGDEHARQIANMALSFIRSIKSFRIPHLPSEEIQLRIGLHSGPCVAGVVGLAMPRYCLFGDSINTASRMESNGKPNRIHISSQTNDCLTQAFGNYVTQARGEIMIKGKGMLQTFWLLGIKGDSNFELFPVEGD